MTTGNNQKVIKCAGIIPISYIDRKVLMIQHPEGHWGFPKGHIENDETEIETALRETKEEVNLDVIIDETKRYEIHYITHNNIDKTSVYYLAKTKNKNVTIQETEIADYKWLNIDDATELLTYDDTKEILTKITKKSNH